MSQGPLIDGRDRRPFIDDIGSASRTERLRINALRAHVAHGRTRIAVEIRHPEEALVQIAFHLHLERQVIVFEPPTGLIKRFGVVEANPVVEDGAAEQAVLSPGHEIRSFDAMAIDAVPVGALFPAMGCLAGRVGPELSDPEMLDVHIESCRVVILRRKIKMVSTSLEKFTAERGCFVSRIQRMGMDIPLEGDFVVQAADVVHLTGPASRLEEVGKLVGHIERATNQTDLVTFAVGITVGLLVGTWTVSVAGVSVGLGSAGGLLAAGLVIGYLRALHPTFGSVPEPARWIFMELGLTIFMAGVGLRAGSGIIETLAQSGLNLLLAGIVVTSVPVAIGYFVGRKVLGINPVLLLGAITGSMTSGASLSIVTAEALRQTGGFAA